MLTLGNGEIFQAIISDMYEKGYTLFYKLLNAKDYGVPQYRERVIIVGFRNDLGVTHFDFPEKHDKIVTLKEALQVCLNHHQKIFVMHHIVPDI